MAGRTRLPQLPRDPVVLRAGTTWAGIWRADQHVASRLGRRHAVLYVEPPMPVSRSRTLRSTLEPVADGVWRARTVVPPGRSTAVGAGAAARVARWTTARLLQRTAVRPQALLTISAALLDLRVAGRRLFWARDDFEAGAGLMGLPPRHVARIQADVARRADVVVCVSEALEELWRSRGARTAVVPNGCDVGALSVRHDGHDPLGHLDRPRIGFMGTIGDRIDPELLTALADTGHPLVLIGPAPRGAGALADVLARDNVVWIGEQHGPDLPAYLHALDVGVVPYRMTEFNERSHPLKAAEYLAAGLPVVGTPLRALRDLAPVHLESDPAAFAARAVQLAREGDGMSTQDRVDAAAQHDWDARIDDLTALLGLA